MQSGIFKIQAQERIVFGTPAPEAPSSLRLSITAATACLRHVDQLARHDV